MTQLWQVVLQSLSTYWQDVVVRNVGPMAVRTVVAVAIVLATIALARAARGASRRGLARSNVSPDASFLLPQVAYYGIMIVGFSLVLGVFGMDWSALLAALGILGLAIGLAFQDVARNFVAGLYLVLERPFRPGDHLKVKDFEGIVEDVSLRTTHLRGADGQLIIIPNTTIFSEVVVKAKPLGGG
jgi:small conductance mechanosensitive channel